MPKALQWRGHLDEVFGQINGEALYLWRAVDLNPITKRGHRTRRSAKFDFYSHAISLP